MAQQRSCSFSSPRFRRKEKRPIRSDSREAYPNFPRHPTQRGSTFRRRLDQPYTDAYTATSVNHVSQCNQQVPFSTVYSRLPLQTSGYLQQMIQRHIVVTAFIVLSTREPTRQPGHFKKMRLLRRTVPPHSPAAPPRIPGPPHGHRKSRAKIPSDATTASMFTNLCRSAISVLGGRAP